MDDVSSSARNALPPGADYAAAIVDTVRHPLLVLDAELRVKAARGAFYRDFKVTPGETLSSRTTGLSTTSRTLVTKS